MKYFLFVLTASLFLSCGASRQTVSPPAPGQEISANPDMPGGTLPKPAFVSDSLSVGEIMHFLTADALEGRDSGSQGIETAAVYIEQYFLKNGIAPYFQTYRDTLLNFPKPAYNLVGVIPGTDPGLREEYILIGAHYDHIGILPTMEADSIANGANDNASGTATVLELARYFGQSASNKRSLIFALFSAEEKGLLGSQHLAERLVEEDLDLYLMLNFEMTGVPMDDKPYLLYLTGYEKSNLAEIVNGYAGSDLVGFLPSAAEFNLFQRSDNYPFHTVFNIPSHTFSSFDFTNFQHYHKAGDEMSLLNLDHMARVVNSLIPVIEGLANAGDQEIMHK